MTGCLGALKAVSATIDLRPDLKDDALTPAAKRGHAEKRARFLDARQPVIGVSSVWIVLEAMNHALLPFAARIGS